VFSEFMVFYEAEGGGQLSRTWVPSAATANPQTSLGSAAKVVAHTDQAFSDCVPASSAWPPARRSARGDLCGGEPEPHDDQFYDDLAAGVPAAEAIGGDAQRHLRKTTLAEGITFRHG
jgi:hypothetical protein